MPVGIEDAYRQYGPALQAAARRVLASDADASDCVHDVLVRVLEREPTYRPERGEFRAYLLVAVRNEAVSRIRKMGTRELYERRAADRVPQSYEFEIPDMVERKRLQHALDALPAEQRTALDLAYNGGLSHVEISERLGVPLGTIKSRLVLGLRKLKSAIL